MFIIAWFHRRLDNILKPFMMVSPEILKALEEHVTPNMFTLETGSGQSTVWFENRGCNHVALEDNSRYAPSCDSVVIAPLVDSPPWYDWSPTYPFDFILIDGPLGLKGRSGVLRVLPECIHPSTSILIDDTDRKSSYRLGLKIAQDYEMDIRHIEYRKGFFRKKYSVLTPKFSKIQWADRE